LEKPLVFANRAEKPLSGQKNEWKVSEVGMIKEVKTMMVLNHQRPSIKDIKEAKTIAAENHCLIKIEWSIPYSGNYHKLISEYDDPEEIFDSLPKVYGV
jgi:hypothetical protein